MLRMNASQITMAETQVTTRCHHRAPIAETWAVLARCVRTVGSAKRHPAPKGMAIAHNTGGMGWRQQAMERMKSFAPIAKPQLVSARQPACPDAFLQLLSERMQHKPRTLHQGRFMCR
jgi:hypothetical protein